MPKGKTKKDLWELAMIYQYDLGGFQYKKEYKPMVQLALMHTKKELKEIEKINDEERKKINKRREIHLKKYGTKWTNVLNKMIIDAGENAGQSLDIAYAQDLLDLHNEKYRYYSSNKYYCKKCKVKHFKNSKRGKNHFLLYC